MGTLGLQLPLKVKRKKGFRFIQIQLNGKYKEMQQ